MRTNRFVVLDGLRGVAAIAVISRHVQPDLSTGLILPESYLAVDLFFLLSGFVLAHAYEGRLLNGLDFWEFLRIRIIRLGPLYWLAGCIAFVGRFVVLRRHLDISVINFAFLPAPGSFHLYPLNFPAWSLGCELAANVLFASLIHKIRGRMLFIPILIGFLSMVVASVVFNNLEGGPRWNDAWVGYGRVLFSFFLGIFLFRVYRRADVTLPVPVGWALPLCLVALFECRFPSTGLYDLMVVAIAFPVVVFLGACSKASRLIGAMMGAFGAASYGIYVLQIPMRGIAIAVARHMHVAPSAPVGLLFCAAVVIAAFVLDRIYDIPVRKWLDNRTRRIRSSLV